MSGIICVSAQTASSAEAKLQPTTYLQRLFFFSSVRCVFGFKATKIVHMTLKKYLQKIFEEKVINRNAQEIFSFNFYFCVKSV
jgi:hypothetical protein